MIPTFASLFLPEAVPHHVNEISAPPSVPLALRTADAQWAYAVEWTRTPARAETPLVITVTLGVTEGAIGVGVLSQAATAFVDHAVVEASGRDDVVQLVAAHPGDLGSIVVRNASAKGGSRATVRNIEVVALNEPLDEPLPALLSAPVPVRDWHRYYESSGLTPIERLRATRFDELTGRTVLRWRDGLTFEVHPGDSLSRVVYVSGTYEPNTLCVLRSLLRPGDVFIDVGGNAGIVSLAAAQWVGSHGRVHAFEPSTREYRRLLDTIGRNRSSRVVAHPMALGARRGTAILQVASARHGGLNTLGRRFAYSDVPLETIEEVDVWPLDHVVADGQIGRVAAIKIDVEGMELHVLRGARDVLARDRPALVVEAFGRALEACGATLRGLEDLLTTSGYVLHAIDEGGGLRRIHTLAGLDAQNVVALPEERANVTAVV